MLTEASDDGKDPPSGAPVSRNISDWTQRTGVKAPILGLIGFEKIARKVLKPA